jgi:hypothetical protein
MDVNDLGVTRWSMLWNVLQYSVGLVGFGWVGSWLGGHVGLDSTRIA